MAPPDNTPSPHDTPPGYEEFLAYVRECKTSAIADDGSADLPPVIRVYGTEPFSWEITAFCDTMGNDKALWAATVICGMVGGDSVTMVSDAFTSSDSPNNPATGQPWLGGELNQAWERGERDGVSECLMFHTAWANGRHRSEASLYEVTGDTLRWTSKPALDTGREPGQQVSGVVPETLHAALSERPEFITVLTQVFTELGMDPAVAAVHRMRVAVESLHEAGFMVLVGGSHPFMAEYLGSMANARLVDLPITDPLEDMLKEPRT